MIIKIFSGFRKLKKPYNKKKMESKSTDVLFTIDLLFR